MTLLPRQQTEYPTWGLLPEATVHGRRETTFLILATLVLVTLMPLLWLGSTRIIDLGELFAPAMPGAGLPVPIGVIPAAAGVIGVLLACELFGRRRAGALIVAGAMASVALIGLSVLARDDAPPIGPALGFATYSLVAQLAGLVVFDGLRKRFSGRHVWLRVVVTAIVAQPIGWAAFAGIMLGPVHADASMIELALGAAVFTTASVIAAALPVAVAARLLTLFLRVDRGTTAEVSIRDRDATAPVKRLQPALIVDVEPEPARPPPEPSRRRRRSVHQPAFSSAELRFFRDGDELS